MSSVRDPGYCGECGEPLVPDLRQCPKCRALNPGFTPFVVGRAQEAPAAVVPTPAAFDAVLAEMAQAQSTGCHVIANIGLTEAGKSWLIARMGKLSGGTYRASLYSSDGQAKHAHLMTSQLLPRTAVDQAYIWHLEPGGGEERNRSGSWRIVDIAGELVADLSFIPKIIAGSGLHDLLLMTLAQAGALVIVIDGRELAHSFAAGPDAIEERRASLDERYSEIVNELVRLRRFIDVWKSSNGAACSSEQLGELKRAISANPQLQIQRDAPTAAPQPWLSLPTLFVISKADALIQLDPAATSRYAAPGPDALHFAEQYFPATLQRAVHTMATFRWAFAAPFVGQPELAGSDAAGDRSLRLDFDRASFGVRQAMQWLDAELLGKPKTDGFTVRDALHDWRRWLPSWAVRGLNR
jgi:hypothetical protein